MILGPRIEAGVLTAVGLAAIASYLWWQQLWLTCVAARTQRWATHGAWRLLPVATSVTVLLAGLGMATTARLSA